MLRAPADGGTDETTGSIPTTKAGGGDRACHHGGGGAGRRRHGQRIGAHGFRQTNLVSDIPGRAQLTDPNLVNPWGLAAGPTTPLWVADNGTGLATLYAGGTGGAPFSIAPLVFTVPMGAPTGQVFNGSNGFKLRTNAGPMPAKFIFDSEAGTISAWTLTNPIQMNVRTKLVVPGAIFKGLAIGFFRHHPALYAADFGHSRVWVVDSHFHVMSTPGAFDGSHAAERLLAVRHPEHRQVGRGQLRQARARRGRRDRTAPASASSTSTRSNGRMVARLASHGALNAPWGLVRAPAHFGRFSGALLVGNFGDGRINAYNFTTGQWLGKLRRPNGDRDRHQRPLGPALRQRRGRWTQRPAVQRRHPT